MPLIEMPVRVPPCSILAQWPQPASYYIFPLLLVIDYWKRTFNLATNGSRRLLIGVTRRIKKTRSFLGPVAENFIKRVSGSDVRLRRKIIRIGFWVIGLTFLYSLLSGTYGVPRIIRLEMEKSALIEANRNKTAALVDAVRIRKRLVSDPEFIESIARSRYYMIYPGETIYRYQGR